MARVFQDKNLDEEIFDLSEFEFRGGINATSTPVTRELLEKMGVTNFGRLPIFSVAPAKEQYNSVQFVTRINDLNDHYQKALKLPIDNLARCLAFLTAFERIEHLKTYPSSGWEPPTPPVWVTKVLEKLTPKHDQVTALLRGEFNRELREKLARPLCKVPLPNKELFPEAWAAAKRFESEQLERLLSDETFMLARIRYGWSDTRAIKHVTTIYADRSISTSIAMIPAGIGASFAGKEGSDLARLPQDFPPARLKSVLEAAAVLYQPDGEEESPYVNLQGALDAALALE